MTKQTRSARKNNATVNLEAELPISTMPVGDDAILGDLLEQLEAVENDATVTVDEGEVIEGEGAVDPTAGVALTADESLLEEIVGDAERMQQKQALYAEQESSAPEDATPPETSPEALTDKPKGKGKGKGKKAKPAGDDAPVAPKEPRATSVTHKPGDLLRHKLGAKWHDFLVFSMTDVAGDQAVLEAKAQEFIDKMNDKDAIADKVREKAIMLLIWMQKGGGADSLNEVMKRAFTVLHEAGELTSGDKGNLQLNLLAKPYSMGTARSQANQMFMLFPLLGITVKEKGKMVANPDSALLPMINQMLGL